MEDRRTTDEAWAARIGRALAEPDVARMLAAKPTAP